MTPPRTSAAERRYRRAGVIALAGLALIGAIVFFHPDPFSHPYEIHVDVSSAAQLSVGSDVRIAGIKVGQVSAIGFGRRDTTRLTLAIDGNGRPLHTDATFTVKPRLILEGNAYIDVSPGTPDARELPAGATVPLARTAVSVQLDQVLDTLDQPVRQGLTGSLHAFATGFGAGGRPGNGSGWAALRTGVRELNGSLDSIMRVATASGGTRPGDLHATLDGLASTVTQLAEDPGALADSVTSFNRVAGAIASQDTALADTLTGFDELLRAAPAPLRALDAALPRLTSFARRLRPSLAVAPPAFEAASKLLEKTGQLVQPVNLPAFIKGLAPVLGNLPRLEARLGTLFSYTAPVTGCITTHFVPVLNMKVQDGANTTGDPVYLDLLHLFTALTSLASAVDGNGGTLRLGVTTGDRVFNGVLPGLGQVVGRLPAADGVRPTWLGAGVLPPFRPDQPCARQALPKLNVAAGPLPDWYTAATALPGAHP